jgi:hypothetical protein
MWILVARAPRPDVAYWPGRRWLALADAVAWPGLIVWLIVAAPVGGIVRVVALSAMIVFALGRIHRALFRNARYQFMTWRLAVCVGLILAIGAMPKALLA